ncbi:MAG: hypothetical protein AAB729_01435 [Patescibacteria group bacterium]
MNSQHQNLSAGTWLQLSLPEQLGNVGSEFGRALNWKKKNQPVYFQKAFDRMLELLDLTINDPRWRKTGIKELCRLREVACAELLDHKELSGNPESLNKYFLQFATLARSK